MHKTKSLESIQVEYADWITQYSLKWKIVMLINLLSYFLVIYDV